MTLQVFTVAIYALNNRMEQRKQIIGIVKNIFDRVKTMRGKIPTVNIYIYEILVRVDITSCV